MIKGKRFRLFSLLFSALALIALSIIPVRYVSNKITTHASEVTYEQPDYISVTYSAGGLNNGDKSVQIASDIKHKYNIESVAHLPCINISKEKAIQVLDSLKENGIENIMALRGDKVDGITPNGDFKYASELVKLIKEKYDFNVIAACYPENHPECTSAIEDLHWLKHKVDCGVDQLVTQLFLDNEYFYAFREKATIAGIDVPIEAGIMPVTNKKQIERMVKMCGIQLPKKFERILDKYENNPEALRDAGIAYAVDQITDLIAEGVDGIHLYTMNKPYVAQKIYDAVHRLI